MRLIWILVALLVVAAGVAVFFFTRPAPEVGPAIDSPYWSEADQLVDVGGRQVRVRITGPRDGEPIVLVHGFSVSLESWDAWAEGLESDYRVIRMDLPGHGLTGPDPEQRYTVQDTADFIGETMDALDIEHAVIGGNSLGGLAAWRFAADHPERADALVLVSPGGYSINGVTEEPVAVPMPVAIYLRSAPEGLVRAGTANLYGDASRMDPSVPERITALMAGNGDAFVERLEVFTLPDPTADLQRISIPTLILHGRMDRMVPVAHSEAMAEAIPGARLITYDDLGHIAHEEDPARTLADVRSFLDEVL